MTARPQVELPELQRYDLEECDWVVGIVKKDDGAYVKFDDYAALAARLAESEARAEGLVAAVRKMHEADAAYGCGFYDDGNWLEAYELTLQLVGIDAAIDAAQEAEREAGSA